MAIEPALQIVSVERIDGTEIIVEFSDATCATYSTEKLIQMAPTRRPMDSPGPGIENGDKL